MNDSESMTIEFWEVKLVSFMMSRFLLCETWSNQIVVSFIYSI